MPELRVKAPGQDPAIISHKKAGSTPGLTTRFAAGSS